MSTHKEKLVSKIYDYINETGGYFYTREAIRLQFNAVGGSLDKDMHTTRGLILKGLENSFIVLLANLLDPKPRGTGKEVISISEILRELNNPQLTKEITDKIAPLQSKIDSLLLLRSKHKAHKDKSLALIDFQGFSTGLTFEDIENLMFLALEAACLIETWLKPSRVLYEPEFYFKGIKGQIDRSIKKIFGS